MHKTGMAAVTYTRTDSALGLARSERISQVGIAAIVVVTLMIAGLTILASLVDRRFSVQTLELSLIEQGFRHRCWFSLCPIEADLT
jgi:hypothetical protein